jgi:uncharacterized damage-inducible protein DinB
MPSIRHLTLGDLDHELASTRRMLERVPLAQRDWQPHPKSMTLGDLAVHTAQLPLFGTLLLAHDRFDVAGPRPPKVDAPATSEALLAMYDHNVAALSQALDATDDAALTAGWAMVRGDTVLRSMPRAAALRSMVGNHLVHHRAQLGVYLRLLDVPVPAMYGRSADENLMG